MIACPLPRLISVAMLATLAATAPATGAGIERASAELVAPALYRIDLSASADAWPVAIYPSSRPDSVESSVRPTTTRTTTVQVKVPGHARVYFHLRPAAGRSRVVALRQIPLEGTLNLRDIGGYRTTDGHYVKWGLVYRSDALAKLTPADYETVNSLGLRLICDLRSPAERTQAPTQWQGGTPPEVITPPAAAPLTGSAQGAQGATQTASYMRSSDDALRKRIEDIQAGRGTPEFDAFYPRMALGLAPTYRVLLMRMISGDLPTLTHCTAGQDRTGVFAAVLLMALGVPRDTVMEDYLLTNRYRRSNEYIESVQRNVQRRLGLSEPPSTDTIRFMEDIHPSNLNAALAAIDAEYGSFSAYLEKGLGLSAAPLAQLRARLLED